MVALCKHQCLMRHLCLLSILIAVPSGLTWASPSMSWLSACHPHLLWARTRRSPSNARPNSPNLKEMLETQKKTAKKLEMLKDTVVMLMMKEILKRQWREKRQTFSSA